MASQFHFVAVRMTPNTCPSWGFTVSFTLTVMVTSQLSLISEIIAFAKGGADNTDNISVWSICIHRTSTGLLFKNSSSFHCGQGVPVKDWACNMFMRIRNPLALSSSLWFVWTASTVLGLGYPFGGGFHRGLSHLSNTGARQSGKLSCMYVGITLIEEKHWEKITTKNLILYSKQNLAYTIW